MYATNEKENDERSEEEEGPHSRVQSEGSSQMMENSNSRLTSTLEALRGQKTINEIGQEYGVHPVMVGQWKKEIQEQISRLLYEDYFSALKLM